MQRFAVVLTHNRPELLARCVAAIGPQVGAVIVIDNASDPPISRASILPAVGLEDDYQLLLVQVPDQPPNLSYLWNVGIGLVEKLRDRADSCGIAVLCDDAIVPPGWFAAVADAMTATGAAIGCSNPWGHAHAPRLKTEPDRSLMERMPGWAWVLNPDSGVRPDESLRWWWGDTDMDWQARHAGGMVMIGGYPVPNERPNDFTVSVPGLATQAGQDGETFAAKWSYRPW